MNVLLGKVPRTGWGWGTQEDLPGLEVREHLPDSARAPFCIPSTAADTLGGSKQISFQCHPNADDPQMLVPEF